MGKEFLLALALAFATVQSFGAVYYVATDGSDCAAGSKDKPFATLNKANKVGIEETKEILTNYLARQDRNINKLYRYAEKLSCLKILKIYLEVLV